MNRQNYFEHDNRGPSTSRNFRGSDWKMGKNRKYNYRGDVLRGNQGRNTFDIDGDVDMMGNQIDTDRKRYNPYGNSRHNNRKKHNNKKNGNKSKHGGNDSLWFKVCIPYGKKAGKDFILNAIISAVKAPFIPVNFQFNKNNAEFYVNNSAIANEIRSVHHHKITTPDGFKLGFHVSKCSLPVASLDAESTKVIVQCMSSLYESMTHTLNLTKFHHNEGLKNMGLYTPLHKPVVFHTVIRIIKDRISEIEALNLSENKLYTLEPVKALLPVCKQMKLLNLKDNRLRNVSELDAVKGMEIIELILDGNPLCDDFKDKTSYISAVRDRFPKLMILDGHELPPPIGFDLGVEACPVSKKCFFAETEGGLHKDLVIQFLDQYYTIYDSGDRSRLLDAYHDHAYFSLSLSRNAVKTPSGGSFSAYILDNRNLLKVTDFTHRFKLLKQGKLSIVNALSELPQTMHDPTSFSIDIFHLSPTLMSFSVIGVFKEVGAEINNATLKTFNRTFVVAPHNAGIAIVNETLFIAHASQDQQSKAFKVPAPTPSPSPAPSNEEKSPSEKQIMVVQLSNQTQMNLDFSTKCLEENDWDYQKALSVFMTFQSQGRIPPEAFIKLEMS